MSATNRIKISKKEFENHLIAKYAVNGATLEAYVHDERCWDDDGNEGFKRLTLYYQVDAPRGNRHCATWMSGEGWEFKQYHDDGRRLTDCCGCFSTYHDDELVCRACYQQVGVGQGDGDEEKEMV